MSPTQTCRYYLMGSCTKGSSCSYLHSGGSGGSKNVCSFYLAGNCSYGTRCLLVHSKGGKKQLTSAAPRPASSSAAAAGNGKGGFVIARTATTSSAPPPPPPTSSSISTSTLSHSATTAIELCKFLKEECPWKGACKLIHGLKCPSCHELLIYPTSISLPQFHDVANCFKLVRQREEACTKECVICFETIINPVSGKGMIALLTCDHSVCLSCAQSWRTTDKTMSKTCPICRQQTYFVVPSSLWPGNAEEKEEMIQQYKDRLSLIDCKLYKHGDGTCPFGTSCFYKHINRQGVLEADTLRFIASDDFEGLRVVPVVTLFDHLNLDGL